MKPFMDQDFLLENDVAKKLYHEYAENMPIYDYHCHISPSMIYENYQFQNIGELMLGGDHYKWRVMLSNGVDEKFIRGDASWHDKWLAFAASLKYCIGNPMFHWTHLELRRVFGIEEILSEKTAEDIWNRANALLATEEYRCRGLIEKFGVKVICTTDDPVDDLEHQTKIAQDPTCKFKVYPAWRPDKVLNIERGGFVDYMNRLSRVSGIHCLNLESMMQALESRLDFFHAHGARLSDHALDTVPYGVPSTHIAGEAFRKAMSGAPLTEAEIASYKTYVLVELARMYKTRGWAQQYHIGAMRNNNPRMFEKYGPDVGFDSIDDTCIAENLSKLLAEEERAGQPAQDHSLLPESEGQLRHRHHAGQLPGRRHSGQDSIRFRLVVLRPEIRHGRPDARAGFAGSAGPFRRHADGLPLLHFLSAPRVLPPHPVQHDRQVGRKRRISGGLRHAGRTGARHLL